jgi:hypothetical protein
MIELLREFAPKKKVNIAKLEKEHDQGLLLLFLKSSYCAGPMICSNTFIAPKLELPLRPRVIANEYLCCRKRSKFQNGTPVLTGDDAEKAKPSPDIFMAAARVSRLGSAIHCGW